MKTGQRMKTKGGVVLFLTILISLFFLNAVAHAAVTYDWKIPDNVRIVQKAPVDGVRTFATITEALVSITDASVTNRYLIKVMPGTYNESVIMKPYVDLEGSGSENTVLTSNSAVGYTIYCADQSVVSDIAITFADVASIVSIVYVPLNVSTTFKNVKVLQPNTFRAASIHVDDNSKFTFAYSTLAYEGTQGNCGIFSRTGSLLMINDSVINMKGSGIYPFCPDGDSVIKNTDMIMETGNGNFINSGGASHKIINCSISIKATGTENVSFLEGGSLEAYNTNITLTGLTGPNTRVFDQFAAVKINNSVISTSSTAFRSSINAAEINNSVISAAVFKDGGSFKIGNSQIIGGHNGVPGVDKVVNCYDENYNPVPNL